MSKLRFLLLRPLLLICIGLPAAVPGVNGAQTASRKPITVEDVTRAAAPAPTAISWAPKGDRIAYVQDRKVWLFEVATLNRRIAVELSALEAVARKREKPARFAWENRRVKESVLQWLPEAQSLLILEAGDLFLYAMPDGKWLQLTATEEPVRDPKISPDGRRISFRLGRELHCLEIESRKLTRLTFDSSSTIWNGMTDWVYPEELNVSTAHWWSPDSSTLAYLQFDVQRLPSVPHVDWYRQSPLLEPQLYSRPGEPNADVRVGVVNNLGGRPRWMDIGETRGHLTARVDWMPGGQALFVQKLSRTQERLALIMVEASTGSARLVLEENNEYWVDVGDDLRFLPKTREFLWSSERDGFRHLYIYSWEDPKKFRQLTTGTWEVTKVIGVDENARAVYYQSAEASPLERHIYRVDFDGKKRVKLTTAPGVHDATLDPTGRFLLDTHSALDSPPRTAVLRTDGSEVALFSRRDQDLNSQLEILPTEIVTINREDGVRFYARLIRPKGFQPGRKHPVVVFVYGGPQAQSVRNEWAGVTWEQALAHRGFVIWQMDNRGTAGRGHKWESAVYGSLGKVELQDQKSGFEALLNMGFVDPARAGVYGWSYGGFMTLHAMANSPGLFRAGIAGAPVTDWLQYDTIYTERYMGLPNENVEGYRSSSPVHFAANFQAPVLLVHNMQDDNVHSQHTLRMADALQQAGKPFEMMLYPQKTHAVKDVYRAHMLETMTAFLERHLLTK